MTREEAIKLLCVEKSIIIEVDGNKGAEKMLQAYDMAIEALSAKLAAHNLGKGEWIPVSERLPNIGDTFLVTVMVGTRIKTDVASNFGSYIDGFWDTFNDWIEDEECHVTAWMPLPEPYKGGDEE